LGILTVLAHKNSISALIKSTTIPGMVNFCLEPSCGFYTYLFLLRKNRLVKRIREVSVSINVVVKTNINDYNR